MDAAALKKLNEHKKTTREESGAIGSIGREVEGGKVREKEKGGKNEERNAATMRQLKKR